MIYTFVHDTIVSAGPYDTRSSNSLTITGEMEFDSADISFLKSEGNFASVILHEMGHILGMYQYLELEAFWMLYFH
jgi:hypothetical protein